MNEISKDEVTHLAQLSSISLSDEESEDLQKDLAEIVNYIKQLDQLDTSGVQPTYQVSQNQNVWREDKINDYGVKRDTLLALAKENSKDNQIKVPKVL